MGKNWELSENVRDWKELSYLDYRNSQSCTIKVYNIPYFIIIFIEFFSLFGMRKNTGRHIKFNISSTYHKRQLGRISSSQSHLHISPVLREKTNFSRASHSLVTFKSIRLMRFDISTHLFRVGRGFRGVRGAIFWFSICFHGSAKRFSHN